MKHAVIVKTAGGNAAEKFFETGSEGKRGPCLTEEEYTREELDAFEAEKPKWIVECRGTHCFLADSDSGEDADGHYCGYFDLVPERAVFDNGKLVGFYLYTDGFRYSGRGRASFSIDDWGYPGYGLFGTAAWGSDAHLFLFSEPDTHVWGDWSLLVREPGKKYESYLDF